MERELLTEEFVCRGDVVSLQMLRDHSSHFYMGKLVNNELKVIDVKKEFSFFQKFILSLFGPGDSFFSESIDCTGSDARILLVNHPDIPKGSTATLSAGFRGRIRKINDKAWYADLRHAVLMVKQNPSIFRGKRVFFFMQKSDRTEGLHIIVENNGEKIDVTMFHASTEMTPKLFGKNIWIACMVQQ